MSKYCQSRDLGEPQRLRDPDHFNYDVKDPLEGTYEKLMPNSYDRSQSTSLPILLNNILRDPQPYVISTIIFLLPSFIVEPIRNYSSSSRSLAPKPPPSPTAWLDGVRGLSALVIYIFHWTMLWFSDVITDAYGAPGSANTVFQLPLVRIIYAGPACVPSLFIISGYVITIKTLSMIYKGGPQNNERVLATLSGAFFRRPFRLCVPAILSTLIFAVLNWQFGFFNRTVMPIPDLKSQLVDWLDDTLKMLNIFNLHKYRFSLPYVPRYNHYLWTISVELKNSFLVYTLLLAFAKVKRWVHLLGVLGIAWIALFSQGDIDAAMFCAGLLLAEMTLMFPPDGHRSHVLPGSASNGNITLKDSRRTTFLSQTSGKPYWIRQFITITTAILGLHLMCYPFQTNVQAGGFKTISDLTPRPFYPGEGSVPLGQSLWSVAVGSVLFFVATTYSAPLHTPLHLFKWITTGKTWSQGRRQDYDGRMRLPAEIPVRNEPFLQIPHTSRFSQYLGWVSYSLYLCHGPVISAFGMGAYSDAKAAYDFGLEIARQLEISGQRMAAIHALTIASNAYVSAFIWSTIPQVIVLFWVSDVVARGIDAPIVKMTQWVWRTVKVD